MKKFMMFFFSESFLELRNRKSGARSLNNFLFQQDIFCLVRDTITDRPKGIYDRKCVKEWILDWFSSPQLCLSVKSLHQIIFQFQDPYLDEIFLEYIISIFSERPFNKFSSDVIICILDTILQGLQTMSQFPDYTPKFQHMLYTLSAAQAVINNLQSLNFILKIILYSIQRSNKISDFLQNPTTNIFFNLQQSCEFISDLNEEFFGLVYRISFGVGFSLTNSHVSSILIPCTLR